MMVPDKPVWHPFLFTRRSSMVNESDKITVSGIDYYPIPEHAPFAISRCGLCLNIRTMKHRKFSILRTKGSKQITFSTRNSGNSETTPTNFTVQRALALCFIPIPPELETYPKNKLVAICKKSPKNIEEASDLNNIFWATSRNVRMYRPVKIYDVNTGGVEILSNMKSASLHLCNLLNLNPSPTLVSSWGWTHGNRFQYKNYLVEIHQPGKL
jgi:hypothetical protein